MFRQSTYLMHVCGQSTCGTHHGYGSMLKRLRAFWANGLRVICNIGHAEICFQLQQSKKKEKTVASGTVVLV